MTRERPCPDCGEPLLPRKRVCATCAAERRRQRQRQRQRRPLAKQRDRDKARERARRARLSAGWQPPTVQAANGERLPIEPLRDWLLSRYGGWDLTELAAHAGVLPESLRGVMRRTDRRKVSMHLVDAISTGLGHPEMLSILYPLPEEYLIDDESEAAA